MLRIALAAALLLGAAPAFAQSAPETTLQQNRSVGLYPRPAPPVAEAPATNPQPSAEAAPARRAAPPRSPNGLALAEDLRPAGRR